jgi:protein gp37
MGTTVEDARVMHRVDTLRQIPAALRFISAEPLIGSLKGIDLTDIHWLIAGGESGAGYRPLNPEWARELRDSCRDSGTAFFFKQVGGPTPKSGGKVLDGVTYCEFPDEVSPEVGA